MRKTTFAQQIFAYCFMSPARRAGILVMYRLFA